MGRPKNTDETAKATPRDKSSKSVTRIAISLILAILLFAGMVAYENYILNKHETVNVVRVKADILSESEKISKADFSNIFEVTAIDKSLDSKNYLHSTDEIAEGYITNDLNKGEIVTKKDISEENEKTAYAKNPIEVSIKVSDISGDVGGILRSGDMVNVFFVTATPDGAANSSVVSQFGDSAYYVDKAIDSSGNILVDDTGSAAYINLIIDESEEETFNNAVVNGEVRMSLIK